MLRPATPLTVMLFAAFVLLMLAVLSTPIIKAIPLGSFQGVNFGVFGLCTQTACSGIEIGYNGPVALATLFTPSDQASFDLPTSTRTTLSAILIVHPVAALLTLVMLIMSIAAHFHSPAHSVKYLLFLFIVSIFAFLTTLLSFLIDVLLFVPHMAWGSYLVLAATILHAMSGLVSCAMRRTLVSRKSRKKQIEQHAEMSGENFYNRQAQAATSLQTRQQPTVPIVTGSIGETDKLPTFATFDKKDDRSSDERVPLTSRSPSDRSPIPPSTGLSNQSDMVMAGAVVPPGQRRSMSISRDQYGNPINNSNPEFDAYGVRRGPSLERMNQNPRGRGGMPPGGYRGRGGYGPPGRGGYGTPPPGAGGRGGYGNRGPPGRGGYGPPPRGYGGSGRGRTPPPPGYQYERSGPYGGSPGPQDPRYNNANNMNPSMPSVSTDSYGAYNPSLQESELPRAESPPPLPGMDVNARALPAAEMEAPLVSPQQGKFGPNIRDSDSDIMGMVNLQQGNLGQGQPPRETFMSDGSRYSQDESQYVPPRAAWNQNGRNSPRMPSPLNVQSRSPIAELPSSSGGPANSRSPPPDRMRASPANGYLEDVDPRFATQRPTPPPIQTEQQQHPYDEIPQGARSPAESERSNFTSISQRGVNPRWNPPPSQLMPGYGGPQMRRGPPQRGPERNDILLNGNPDFQMPGQRSGSGGGGAGRMVPGSAYPAI